VLRRDAEFRDIVRLRFGEQDRWDSVPKHLQINQCVRLCVFLQKYSAQ